ncbi:hypothetical protein BV379_00205 [Rhodovulum sulfidophilum]|nr:hypothetical protein BV379_00205 [Rhodovulum sulfidophilum]
MLAIWFDLEMSWNAMPTGRLGHQQTYSDTAIRSCLTMKGEGRPASMAAPNGGSGARPTLASTRKRWRSRLPRSPASIPEGFVAQSKKSAAAAAYTKGFLRVKQRNVLPRKPLGDARSFDYATKPFRRTEKLVVPRRMAPTTRASAMTRLQTVGTMRSGIPSELWQSSPHSRPARTRSPG